METSALLTVAVTAAQDAGRLIRQQAAGPGQPRKKGFRDLVTASDFAAQALITARIRAAYPAHGFLAEEEDGDLPASGPVLWLIDPIDGTSNFSRQIPVSCVSIAAADASGRLLAGVIYDPHHDETFSASAGGGAYVNGNPILVSATRDMIRSIVAFDWAREPALRQTTVAAVTTLARQTQTMRALGSAALALAWVAAGRLDGYFNLGGAPWDAAAGALLIREAGGTITHVNGADWGLRPATGGMAATNGTLQPDLQAALWAAGADRPALTSK